MSGPPNTSLPTVFHYQEDIQQRLVMNDSPYTVESPAQRLNPDSEESPTPSGSQDVSTLEVPPAPLGQSGSSLTEQPGSLTSHCEALIDNTTGADMTESSVAGPRFGRRNSLGNQVIPDPVECHDTPPVQSSACPVDLIERDETRPNKRQRLSDQPTTIRHITTPSQQPIQAFDDSISTSLSQRTFSSGTEGYSNIATCPGLTSMDACHQDYGNPSSLIPNSNADDIFSFDFPSLDGTLMGANDWALWLSK